MSIKQTLTYRYRVKDKGAEHLISRAQACNFVWNYCVNAQKHVFKWGSKWPSAFDLIKLTTGTAAELGLHSDTVSAICRQFVKSRNQHRKCPRYRGKKSLGWVPFIARAIQFSADGAVVYKGRPYPYWNSRKIGGDVLCGSFSQDARRRWYVNLVCEVEVVANCPAGEIGIDLGLKTLATLSNGEKIENPRHFRQYEQTLAKAQRAGRKQRVRAIYARIANARRHHHHIESTRIARAFGRIVVGNVNSGKLAKTRMAKSVLDAGWSSFRAMLSYKAIRHGGEYLEVDERYSTQCCSECGSIAGPKGVSQLGVRTWECGECGAVHDRDVNASKNILRFAAEHRRPVAGIAVVEGSEDVKAA